MQGDFFLTQWVFLGMRWLFENITGESIVLTVVISTIIIRALTVIGDIKSRQSSMKMQGIQPQLDKIRKKYENDPERMNRESQKLMKENGVSMFGGCLPLLFTMPLFFIFIAAFRQWGSEMMVKLIVKMNEDPAAGLEMFKNFKFLWVNNMWQPDSGLQPVIQTAESLFAPANAVNRLLIFQEHPEYGDLFVKLGFFVKDASQASGYALNTVQAAAQAATGCACGTAGTTSSLAQSTLDAYNRIMAPCVNLYAGHNNGWFVFPIVCGATTFLSSWIMNRNQPKNETTQGSMKLMQWMMPVMTLVFCLTSNACFALYWCVSNIASMVTTLLINKSFAKQAAAEGATDAAGSQIINTSKSEVKKK